MEQNTNKNTAGLKEPWKKGESGNPNGRPLGQRNYATIYREALIKLAEMNGMEPEQMETDILLKGLASARKGDYRFWKDVHDRLHGQPKQKIEEQSDVTVTYKWDDNNNNTLHTEGMGEEVS